MPKNPTLDQRVTWHLAHVQQCNCRPLHGKILEEIEKRGLLKTTVKEWFMIKAVLFDVDGVLLDSFEANLKFYQDLMVYAGYKAPTRIQFQPLFATPMKEVIRILLKTKDEDILEKVWLAGKEKVPYPIEYLKTPDSLHPTIKTLAAQYRLGIVTSRIRGRLFQMPQLRDLEPYFTEAVYYEDTDKHKPEPEPLLLAAHNLRVNPSEAIYIGDALSDVQAARAADMKVILYAENNLSGADVWTTNFGEIPRLVHLLSTKWCPVTNAPLAKFRADFLQLHHHYPLDQIHHCS